MTDPILAKIATTATARAPTAGAWLIRTAREHHEFSQVLRAALARAICDDPDAPGVPQAIQAIENSLNHTTPPAADHRSRAQRFRLWLLHHGPLGRIRRPPKELPLDGPDFFDFVRRWIRKAFDDDWPKEELAQVKCGQASPERSVVLSRLPDALQDVLLEDVTPFRERLLAMIRAWRDRTAIIERERRNRLLANLLRSVAAAGATAAIVEVTWGSHPGSAALAAVAALGVAGLYEAAQRHRIRGIRYRALRLIAEIHETVTSATGGALGPPSPGVAHELEVLVSLATEQRDHDLLDALEQLEDALKHWTWNPASDAARLEVGRALARAADLVERGRPPDATNGGS